MSEDVLRVANSLGVWLMAAPIVILTIGGVASPPSPIPRSRLRVAGDGEVRCRKAQRNGTRC